MIQIFKCKKMYNNVKNELEKAEKDYKKYIVELRKKQFIKEAEIYNFVRDMRNKIINKQSKFNLLANYEGINDTLKDVYQQCIYGAEKQLEVIKIIENFIQKCEEIYNEK